MENKFKTIKVINSSLYGEIKISNTNSVKTLTQEEFKNGEQGYIYVPWVFVEHTEESLKDYNIFMNKYRKQHEVCPKCGNIEHSTTLIGYVLNSDKKEDYKDLNTCVCSVCKDKHTAHDRISVEEFDKLSF